MYGTSKSGPPSATKIKFASSKTVMFTKKLIFVSPIRIYIKWAASWENKRFFCIWENKDADLLRCNCEADQRICFHYLDRTIHLLLTYKISSIYPSPVAVQPGLCQTCSKSTLLVFHVAAQIRPFLPVCRLLGTKVDTAIFEHFKTTPTGNRKGSVPLLLFGSAHGPTRNGCRNSDAAAYLRLRFGKCKTQVISWCSSLVGSPRR